MSEKIEPILILLAMCMVFFTGVLFASEIWFKDDSQIFQVVANILAGVTGAFLGRIKPAQGAQGQPGADAVVAPSQVNITEVKPNG